VWCRDIAGTRLHGTTRQVPRVVFETVEQATLLPLSPEPFDRPTWAEATVHPDHHVVFARGFYSVPTRYVGEMVWVRGTATAVRIFDREGDLIWTWEPATRKEPRRTNWDHYPPGKRAFLIQHPRYCRDKARQLGAAVLELVERLLASHSYAHLRKVQAILRLGEKYGASRLDRACARALAHEDLDYRTVKNILVGCLELEGLCGASGSEGSPVEDLVYVRPGESFVHEPRVAAGGAQ